MSQHLSTDSELLFGKINHDRYTGELKYHDVVDKRFFTIKLDDVLYNGKSTGYCRNANPPCRATPDSGSTSFGVPQGFKTGFDKLVPSRDCTISQWEHDGDLTFVIEGEHYTLKYNHFVRRLGRDPADPQKAKCEPAMLVMHFMKYPNMENLFILGDAFMSTFYTVFDREHDRVGLARAKHHRDEETILRESDHTAYMIDARDGKVEKHYKLP